MGWSGFHLGLEQGHHLFMVLLLVDPLVENCFHLQHCRKKQRDAQLESKPGERTGHRFPAAPGLMASCSIALLRFMHRRLQFPHAFYGDDFSQILLFFRETVALFAVK